MPSRLRWMVAVWIVAAWIGDARAAEPAKESSASTVGDAATEATGEEFFERKIRPLLVQHCYSCHGRGQRKGGLALDSRESLLAGGESGVAVSPGKPEESLLLTAVGYEGDVQMPPAGKLAETEIAALRQWLAMGAPWPAEKPPLAGAPLPRGDGSVTDADRAFWSFQPIGNPPLPAVADESRVRKPLDRFVLARLEAEHLQPVGEAEPRDLIRRAYYDLIGLPPTAKEVEEFVAACARGDDVYETLIDRLLNSPHYGERWARHWLDVARYGEDQAHTFQARLYPSGYRYRDWVVASFNRDLPYDQFIVAQVAADLLPEGDVQSRLPALGLLALGPVYYGDAGCSARARADEYDDRIDTLCRGLLGLTVSCARCHDHKFDPISTRDYYALAGIFASTQYVEAPLASADVVRRYEAAAESLKRLEQRLKDSQAAEARRLGESFAPRTAEYLTAVVEFERRRKDEPNLQLADAAKSAGLNALVLERWRQHLEADRIGRTPLFADWRTAAAAGDAPAIAKAAAALQDKIEAAIAARRTLEDHYEKQTAALKPGEAKPAKPALDAAIADLLKSLVDDRNAPLSIPKDKVEALLPADRREILADIARRIEEAKKSLGPKYPIAHAVGEGTVANARVHVRGNPKDLADEVPRRFLAVLSAPDASPFADGSGRLELARAIADPRNPLTARVMVNRVWQHLLGRGIVGTPSNFGLLGERPTHPELLDHLAAKFIASGWSIKQLQREIMLSATYRRATTHDATNEARDPENRLLWRANRRRLDVEAWRDSVLAVCGNLDPTLGGPSVSLSEPGNCRRTVYAAVSRHDLNPMLRLFDFPDPNLTSERRVMTTVPMQQLFMLNSDFMIRQAKLLAERLSAVGLPDDEARIDEAYRIVLGRAPSETERAIGREFIAAAQSEPAAAGVKLSPWEQFVQALLSTNEFLFID